MIDLFVLYVGPMCHIKLLVNGEPPFVSIVTDSTNVSLRTHVLTVKRVALRVAVEKLLGLDSLCVGLRANHTLTEAARLVRHGAPAEYLDIAFMGRAFLKDNMAFLVRVRRCAVVGRVGDLTVELDHIGCGALGHVLAHMLGMERKT